MTSILTNNGAMVALQTLKSINNDLGTVQEQISTGKKVGTATDNAATWAISKTMEADVGAFKQISEGLSVGESTVAVARDASETTTDLLKQMKEKIVQSQSTSNADDRTKIQADISALKEQVSSVVGAAQFNGVNLLKNNSLTAGSGTMNILSSLDRTADGSVDPSYIDVKKADLGTQQQKMGTTAATTGNYITGTAGAINGTTSTTLSTFTIADGTVAAGIGYRISFTVPAGNATAGSGAGAEPPVAGQYNYVARDGDTAKDVVAALAAQINGSGAVSLTAAVGTSDADGNTGLVLDFAADGDGLTVGIAAFTAAGATVGGGLAEMSKIDVTTDAGSEKALAAIDDLIKTSVDAAAQFGTSQNRIETQNNFVGKLTDNLKAGIGSMVDADMEEASARLKALQTQQQLGIQSLSIANQAPGAVMSLFR